MHLVTFPLVKPSLLPPFTPDFCLFSFSFGSFLSSRTEEDLCLIGDIMARKLLPLLWLPVGAARAYFFSG